jgi:hypothetical protein
VFFQTRGDTALEIMALRQQLAVLKRKHPRPQLDRLDRIFWVALRVAGPVGAKHDREASARKLNWDKITPIPSPEVQMSRSLYAHVAAAFALVAMDYRLLMAASIQGAKPEDVGLSSERLVRIHDTIQRHIGEHDVSGAVTIVARRGRLAYFEAHGAMDLESAKGMPKEALFWIASMSKPITGAAIMMLMEEGKLRLTNTVLNSSPNSAR